MTWRHHDHGDTSKDGIATPFLAMVSQLLQRFQQVGDGIGWSVRILWQGGKA